MITLFLLFSCIVGDEQFRVIEFVNKCNSRVDVVSTVNPNPALLPPNDPVCHATAANCKQPGPPGGGCSCTAGVIASIQAGGTKAFLEHLMRKGDHWERPSVNYRPDFPGRQYGNWNDGAPAEFTFIQSMDWYDISMIPPGCASGHWNQYENDYCFGDGNGAPVPGNPTSKDSQQCFDKGGSIWPGHTNPSLRPPANGYYCAMPKVFVFSYQGQQYTIYPCRQSDPWVAASDPNCKTLYPDNIKEAAFDYIRNQAFHCCWGQAKALRGAAAAPGIGASFTIEAVGATDRCQTRECFVDFTKPVDAWDTTSGCKLGYQYPYDDLYSTQTCTPPETYNAQLGVTAKTYRVTYCPNGGPTPPGPTPPPKPTPTPGKSCPQSVCSWEQCGATNPWVCYSGDAFKGCAASESTWSASPACSAYCDTRTCAKHTIIDIVPESE